VNILAIGAHPDDIELGCGGVILKAARQGHNIFMFTLTRGSASGDPVKRTEELMRSARFVGAHTLWIDDFEDTKLNLSSELINSIEYFVNKSKADIIYTHSRGDTHHDHRVIAEATLEAGRFIPNIMAYEMPMTREFRPQVYYDISDVIEEKIELVNIFFSQKEKMFIKANAIKGLAQYRALQSRLNSTITSVECFEVMKLVFEKDFVMLKAAQEHIAYNIPSHDKLERVLSVNLLSPDSPF
jgi:LmbE family N-acetylglucosaminyl deacetylase